MRHGERGWLEKKEYIQNPKDFFLNEKLFKINCGELTPKKNLQNQTPRLRITPKDFVIRENILRGRVFFERF